MSTLSLFARFEHGRLAILFMVDLQKYLQCTELLWLIPRQFTVTSHFTSFTLEYVLVGNVLLYWDEVQFGTGEFCVTAPANLAFKQLVLVGYVGTLVPQQAEQLVVHLACFQN
jgi:hypothetical protein